MNSRICEGFCLLESGFCVGAVIEIEILVMLMIMLLFGWRVLDWKSCWLGVVAVLRDRSFFLNGMV